MRVLHVYKSSPTNSHGGVEKFISCLARNIKPLGVRSTVMSIGNVQRVEFHKSKYYTEIKCPQHFELASTKFSGHSIRILGRIIKKYDVIHLHHPDPFASQIYTLSKNVGTVCVVTYHSDIVTQKWLEKLYRPLNSFFFKQVNTIVFTSPQYLTENQLGEATQSKSYVIPIGIDEPPTSTKMYDEISKWQKILPKKFILFVGQFRSYKGMIDLFNAMSKSTYQLVIIGGGKLEARLQKIKLQKGLDNVTFLGELGEIDKYAVLNLCSALVLPSCTRAEAFGISLVEAASVGKPLISCKIGTGTSFINIHNFTGIEVPPNEPICLENAISSILANEDTIKNFGRNARQHYLQLFTAKKMAKEYFKIYTQLIFE